MEIISEVKDPLDEKYQEESEMEKYQREVMWPSVLNLTHHLLEIVNVSSPEFLFPTTCNEIFNRFV